MRLISIILFLVTLLGGNAQPVTPSATAEIAKPATAFEPAITEEAPSVESFAKCLTENGAVFYGSSTCGHCKTQKELFGDAMEFINYVECNPFAENSNAEECAKVQIEAYPTWIIDGKKIIGTQQLEKLAEITACKI